METQDKFPYRFTQKQFEYKGEPYIVVLTPELYPEDGALDFTGNYIGIFISESKGTKVFQLEPDVHLKWVSHPKSMDPGLIDIIDGFITEMRK